MSSPTLDRISTFTLQEKVERLRDHANARVMLAGMEAPARSFDEHPWPVLASSIPRSSSFFATFMSPEGAYQGHPLEAAGRDREQEQNEFLQDNNKFVQEDIKQCAEKGDRQTLEQKIEARRKASEKRLIESNNAYWNKVGKIVEQLPPDSQDEALNLADKVQAFVVVMFNKVLSFIEGLLSKIWDAIKETVHAAVHWFQERMKDVSTFFRCVFG